MRSIGVVICKIEDMNDDVSKEERANDNYTNKNCFVSFCAVCCVVLLLVHMCHSTRMCFVVLCAVRRSCLLRPFSALSSPSFLLFFFSLLLTRTLCTSPPVVFFLSIIIFIVVYVYTRVQDSIIKND